LTKWEEIAGNFGNSPIEIESARLRLAEAMLSIATEGSTDVAALKAGTFQVILPPAKPRTIAATATALLHLSRVAQTKATRTPEASYRNEKGELVVAVVGGPEELREMAEYISRVKYR
jgi:hypothetical protein